MNICLVLAYDASVFATLKDIIDVLKTCLEMITQEKLILHIGLHTDPGVHAQKQVINCITRKTFDPKKLLKSLNRMLPVAIRIWHIKEMPLNFHAPSGILSMKYHYWISCAPFQNPCQSSFVWHVAHHHTHLKEKMRETTKHIPSIRRMTLIEKSDLVFILEIWGRLACQSVRALIYRIINKQTNASHDQLAPPWGLFLKQLDYKE